MWRDLTPCIWHAGRLFVAPGDCDGVLALNAASGQVLWSTDLPQGALDATQLLGVAGNHLIASGRRLWWFDVQNGRVSGNVQENPFPREPAATLAGFGRGLLVGSQIFWPVRDPEDRILVFDAASGAITRQPIELSAIEVSAGNLVAGRGYLLVAGPQELVALRVVQHE